MSLSPTASRAAVRKPLAVWVLQGVAIVFAVAAVQGVVGVTRDLAAGVVSDRGGAIVFMLLRIVLLGVLLLTVLACQRRKDHGRLLGMLCIACAFLTCGAGLFGMVKEISSPAVGADRLASLHAGMGAGVGTLALVGYWFYAFGFTVGARAYFNVEPPR